MCQIADLADALDKPQRIFVDEQVFNDVGLDLRVGHFKADVFRIELDFFQDVKLNFGPVRCI